MISDSLTSFKNIIGRLLVQYMLVEMVFGVCYTCFDHTGRSRGHLGARGRISGRGGSLVLLTPDGQAVTLRLLRGRHTWLVLLMNDGGVCQAVRLPVSRLVCPFFCAVALLSLFVRRGGFHRTHCGATRNSPTFTMSTVLVQMPGPAAL